MTYKREKLVCVCVHVQVQHEIHCKAKSWCVCVCVQVLHALYKIINGTATICVCDLNYQCLHRSSLAVGD